MKAVAWIVAGLIMVTLIVSSCGREPDVKSPPAVVPKQAHPAALAVPPNPASFGVQGPVSSLKATDIVFSSGLPLDKSMNTLWCSSMVMAWQEANAHFPQGKLALQNEPELTAQLNTAPPAKASLPEEWYYTGFGRTPDPDLPTRLITELKARFPDVGEIEWPGDPTLPGFISLAYLRGGAVFNPPFEENPGALSFPALSGKSVQVDCFGICDYGPPVSEAVRRHVKVLYGGWRASAECPPLGTFAVDLAADNPDVAVILAAEEPADSLQATWQVVEEKAAKWKYRRNEHYTALADDESILVPTLAFQLDKLMELGLRTPDNPAGAFVPYDLYQRIGFNLTASGAIVSSVATSAPAGMSPARDFSFDRPFLITLKLRKAEEPFFLMWVANTELMRKR